VLIVIQKLNDNKSHLFHDLLLSPIYQHSVWSEITSHKLTHSTEV